MVLFVDTSIWGRFLDPDHPLGSRARSFIAGAHSSGVTVVVSFQVVRELWSVLTRPVSSGGGGLAALATREAIESILGVAEVLPDNANQFETWLRLVEANGVSGRQVHDASHIAFMLSHGIRHLLTLDRRDFGRYAPEGFVVVHP